MILSPDVSIREFSKNNCVSEYFIAVKLLIATLICWLGILMKFNTNQSDATVVWNCNLEFWLAVRETFQENSPIRDCTVLPKLAHRTTQVRLQELWNRNLLRLTSLTTASLATPCSTSRAQLLTKKTELRAFFEWSQAKIHRSKSKLHYRTIWVIRASNVPNFSTFLYYNEFTFTAGRLNANMSRACSYAICLRRRRTTISSAHMKQASERR